MISSQFDLIQTYRITIKTKEDIFVIDIELKTGGIENDIEKN